MGSMGCMVAFMLPFVAVGIFTAVQAVRSALMHDWQQAITLGFFALTFGGVGVGGIIGAIAGKRRFAALQALRDAHASAPWLRRPDWAAGHADDGSRTNAASAWVFAIFWNLMSLPAAFFGARDSLQKPNPAALLVLLFPAVGVGLLVWAVRSTLRYRRYGVSRFELTTMPGVIGHSLAGTLRLPEPLRPEGGFEVTLCCVRRHTTGGGRNRSTSESILWQEDRRVPSSGTSLPLAFAIPPDALPSDDSNASDRRIWRLRVAAAVPGVDYGSVFEVPVFRTPESDRPRTAEEEQATKDPAMPLVYHQPPTSRIEVSTNRRGTEIYFPRGRNPGFTAGLTAFLALWCVAIWATIHFRAPLFFPVIFGVFGILILVGVLDSWLKVTRVTVAPDGVTVAHGYLAAGAGRMIPAGEITDVATRITMQAGNTPYYDVTIVQTDGKRLSAGNGVRDRHEAEWLAATIRSALGR